MKRTASLLILLLAVGVLLSGVTLSAGGQEKEQEPPPKEQEKDSGAKDKQQKKPQKVYTNQDLKNAKGNIATSSLATKPVPNTESEPTDPMYTGEGERRQEEVNRLEAVLIDLETARQMHRQSEESIAQLPDRLLAAVGDPDKLRTIRREKELLQRESAYWAGRVRQAERRLADMKIDLEAKGFPPDLLERAREQMKKTEEGDGKVKEGGKKVRSIGG
jgi:hypothetical protein